MARKPNAAPSSEPELPAQPAPPAPGGTASPVRRGRKPKAAPPASEPVSAGENETAETGAYPALPVTGAAPAKGRPGRKPKGWEEAAASALFQQVMEQQPAPDADQPEAAAEPARAGNNAMTAEAAYPVSAGENATAGSTASPRSSQDAAPAAQPAAQWDRAADTVRFDWAAIERTASQDGPNQVMARLLVAARAEGANSRWPL